MNFITPAYWMGCIKKWLFLSFLLLPCFLPAQKFHFQNYNVQQGLIQSQVLDITQDRFDNLWFCTLGGISRFDGKSFTNYSETDGLIANYASTILADRNSNIWIGTPYGISRFNGSVFKNYRLSKLPNGNVVWAIQQDGQSRIWVLSGFRLYLMDQDEKPVLIHVSGEIERLTTIQVDKNGSLWAAVMNKGVYRLDPEGWKLIVSYSDSRQRVNYQKLVFDRVDNSRFFLLSGSAVFYFKEGGLQPLVLKDSLGKITNIYQDKTGNLWLAASRGLYQYSDTGLIAFNEPKGFEGNNTDVIYQDRENNIWLGTNGTGVFRYSAQPFLIYDEFSARGNASVMPMLAEQNRIYLGTDGEGLMMLEGSKMSSIKGMEEDPFDKRITGLFHGPNQEIYILSSAGRLYKYTQGKMSKVSLGDVKGCVNDVYPDSLGGFWLASCFGLIYITPEGKAEYGIKIFANKLLPLAGDSMLVATDSGLYLSASNFKYRRIEDSLLNTSKFMAMAELGKYYLLATANKGFIVYNRQTGKHRQFTTRDGLNADFIYSVVTDKKNQIWLGTGRGINKIEYIPATEDFKISNLSIPGDISSAECNQGAALIDNKNNLWMGTVAGLFKFFPDAKLKQTYLPPVVLQQVQVFSKEIPSRRYSSLQDSWYNIPKNLVLHHNENHLSFSFRCPSYLNSDAVLYQYQLEGLEKNYSALTPNHFVVYPALPPGHYTFRVKAFVEGIGYSTDNVDFSFDIEAAFYQTLYFKFLLLLLVMGLILWIQWLRIRFRQKRIQQMEEVKRDENIKVRQTASEDFHDEVGNSLTRIQVLTDVLHTKLGSGHEEEKRIIGQIKENVSGLYQGTRDILWALNPESDKMKEIGQRLESLGVDVFQDTGICFEYENLMGITENLKLPGNYNRNIMMIFKEVMSNCLKHAQATRVKLIIQASGSQEVQISLSDDGIGFNQLFIKKGHGFQNMQKRANRINANFSVLSNPGEGACYTLKIPLNRA